MTIADYIRLGAAVHKEQCFYALFKSQNQSGLSAATEATESCVIGAFLVGLTGLEVDIDAGWRFGRRCGFAKADRTRRCSLRKPLPAKRNAAQYGTLAFILTTTTR